MILFADCFDNYATADILAMYTQVYTSSDFLTPTIGAYGRRSTQGMQFSTFASTGLAHCAVVGQVLPNTTARIGLGVAVQFTGSFGTLRAISNTSGGYPSASLKPLGLISVPFQSAISNLILFRSNSLTQVAITLNTNGTISAVRGSGIDTLFAQENVTEIYGTSSQAFLTDTYYYLEAAVTIDGSGGVVEVRVNGDVWLALTGLDTLPPNTAAVVDEIALGMVRPAVSTSFTMWIDDLVIWNTDASDPVNTIVDFLGDVELNYCPPIADVVAEWTPLTGTEHFAMVDEIPPDGDGSYNSTDVVNAVDTFQPSCILPDGADVKFVTVVYDRRRPSGGNTSTCPVWRIGSTNYLRTAQGDPSTYAYWQGTWTKDPSTSGAITGATFNAASFGYKKVS